MNAITRNIPNLITSCNLGAGCMAIICASHGVEPFWGMKGFEWAFIFIAIGALADFLDGFFARLLHAYSNLGKELDSLCDLVTFGVAPALILFYILPAYGADPWLQWTLLLIPICGAFRLARFNIDTRQTSVFIGLPIPANAIFWIGYCSLIAQGVGFLLSWYVLIPVMLVECWLMNSPVRMFSLKFTNYGFQENWPRYVLVIAAAVFCTTLQVGGLLWLVIFYACLSAALKNNV